MYLGIDILLSPFHFSFRIRAMRTKRSTPIYILKSFITPFFLFLLFFFFSSPTNPYPRFFTNSSRRVLKRSSKQIEISSSRFKQIIQACDKNIWDSSYQNNETNAFPFPCSSQRKLLCKFFIVKKKSFLSNLIVMNPNRRIILQ